MRIVIVVGVRPNFIKAEPVLRALKEFNSQNMGMEISYRLVHTGQHFDDNMSESIFTDLKMETPIVNLNCYGTSHAETTGKIMMAFESYLNENPTDYVMVVGDVDSTLACAIVTKKMNLKLIHAESGLRSGDMSMPEETNRILVDSIADLHFTTTNWATKNLLQSGVKSDKIFQVGNLMIDTLLHYRSSFRKPQIWDKYELSKGNYLLLTLHRPGNVDDINKLEVIMDNIASLSNGYPIVFPVQPRTKKKIEQLNIRNENLILLEPLSYLEFGFMLENCLAILTDSGGVSEESTVMGIPCITFRENTERPETIIQGTNVLVGNSFSKMKSAFNSVFDGSWKCQPNESLWDGQAAKRLVDVLVKQYEKHETV